MDSNVLNIFSQLAIAISSPLTYYLSSRSKTKTRLIGFILTLLVQPVWVYTTLSAKPIQYGAFLTSFFFCWICIRDIYRYYKNKGKENE